MNRRWQQDREGPPPPRTPWRETLLCWFHGPEVLAEPEEEPEPEPMEVAP